jgi:Transposase DDE domain group 1
MGSPPAGLAGGRLVDGLLVIDLDATFVTAHSDNQGAAGTYKGGFGFHPLAAWLDRGDGTGEPLAAVLRPGNAAANHRRESLTASLTQSKQSK